METAPINMHAKIYSVHNMWNLLCVFPNYANLFIYLVSYGISCPYGNFSNVTSYE